MKKNRASEQPATRFRVDLDMFEKPIWCQHRRRHQIQCWNCGKRRWAKNLVVQVYYDQVVYSCKSGCGCRAQVRVGGR